MSDRIRKALAEMVMSEQFREVALDFRHAQVPKVAEAFRSLQKLIVDSGAALDESSAQDAPELTDEQARWIARDARQLNASPSDAEYVRAGWNAALARQTGDGGVLEGTNRTTSGAIGQP